MNFSTILGFTLSLLVVFGQILILALALRFAIFKKGNAITNWIGRNGMLFAFIVTAIAVLGSLSYSDILGFEPCKLCWFQRILMYPQLIILGIGMRIKDRSAALYCLVLSMIGMAVAWYHYLMQLGFVPATCSTVGYSVSCAKVFTMHFGYITIPMMALTAFILNIAFLLMYRNGGDAVTK